MKNQQKNARLPMAALALMIAASAPEATATQITFSTDSATQLVGSFSMDGATANVNDRAPGAFASLPEGTTLQAFRFHSPTQDVKSGGGFATTIAGVGDSPVYTWSYEIENGSFSGLTFSGTYTNGGLSMTDVVDWQFTNFTETGGANGTFSGNFSFVVRGSQNVPDGGTSAALFGLALLGLGGVRFSQRTR